MTSIYAWLMKLLISRQVKFEDGQIIVLGENALLVPVNFFVKITQDALKKGEKELNDLYFAAWTAGFIIVNTFIRSYKLKTPEEKYQIAMDVLALAGIGDYKTIEFRPGFFSHFKVFNNPIPLKFYPSNEPVDHFLRGANAGGGTLVHNRVINCVELNCAAINKKECTFINATKEILERDIDKKILNSQLDLKYLLKKEVEFIKKFGYDIKI